MTSISVKLEHEFSVKRDCLNLLHTHFTREKRKKTYLICKQLSGMQNRMKGTGMVMVMAGTKYSIAAKQSNLFMPIQ